MRRRLVWLLGGWVVGTATAAWVRRRVRRGVRRYVPEYLRREVADRASALVDGARQISWEVLATRADGPDDRSTRRPVGHRRQTHRHRRPIGDIRPARGRGQPQW